MSRYYDDNIFHTGIMDQDDICHYGVKGMKWRKRLAARLNTSASHNEYRASKYKREADYHLNSAATIARKRGSGYVNGIKSKNGSKLYTGDEYSLKSQRDRANTMLKQKKKHNRIAKIKRKLAKIIGGR